MTEENKPYQPPPPDLSPPPPPPEPHIPVGPPPSGAKQGSPKVRVIEDSTDEGEPGGIAPVNTRIIAAVIDVLVASGIYWMAAMILPDLVARLSWVLWAGYLVTRDSLPFLKGQSIGKMAMKLKVEKQGGGDITGDWRAAVVRNIALIIPLFAVVEAIVLFTREDKPEKGLRLGDEWAKTKVVVAGSSSEEPSDDHA
jgi:uncharacterized RDD family membrane protein YckC